MKENNIMAGRSSRRSQKFPGFPSGHVELLQPSEQYHQNEKDLPLVAPPPRQAGELVPAISAAGRIYPSLATVPPSKIPHSHTHCHNITILIN
ncbi:unnamed protein product [Linum trigynum]|uniref:Uncharacterized protein n=1 Tax=Linum trigynum TaxID=586398 RepID=A0AAV2GUT4_9ROSI